jgi:RNA polymerase primary sigma factor
VSEQSVFPQFGGDIDADAIDEVETDEISETGAGDEIDGLMRYLREIGQYAFLTREEEIRLSRQIQAGALAESRLASEDHISPREKIALGSCVASARAEAARLGIWCGLPAERPESWTEADHLAEDVRLANLVQAGHIARFTLTQQKGLSIVDRAEFQAQIATARYAIEQLGLAWTNDDAALAQLMRLDIPEDEKLRVDVLFTAAQRAFNRLQTAPVLSRDERIVLLRDRERARRGRDTLVERNLRLVVSIAKRYNGHGLDLEDLTGFGNIGLIESAEKYDWRRGTRFSTYASLWIRQRILRSISDTGRMIRMPSYRVDDTRKINRAIPELAQKHGHTPTTAEIAAAVGLDDDEVRRLMELSQPTTSLEHTVSDDEADLTFGTLVPDPDVDVEEEAANSELRRKLRQLFVRAGLDQRDVTILRQRFEEEYTFDMIAAEHRLTRERVRQLIAEIRRPIIGVANPWELDQYLSPALIQQIATQRGLAC